MLRFNGTKKAHFVVDTENIKESLYRDHLCYEDSHPILRVLKPYLFHYVAGASKISLDTDEGLIDDVTISPQVEKWLKAVYEGKATNPMQFAVQRWASGSYTIELDFTAGFVFEYLNTGGYWEKLSETVDDLALGIDCDVLYDLLSDIDDSRINLKYIEDEEYPWFDLDHTASIYKTERRRV